MPSQLQREWQSQHAADIQARIRDAQAVRARMKAEGEQKYAELVAGLEARREELHKTAQQQQQVLSEGIERNDNSHEDGNPNSWARVADIVDKVNTFMKDASIAGTPEQVYLKQLLDAKVSAAPA